jgi:hypothetical protein
MSAARTLFVSLYPSLLVSVSPVPKVSLSPILPASTPQNHLN